jgi:radical SAM superfamily enzyme YgiQ (UPF0313 family)
MEKLSYNTKSMDTVKQTTDFLLITGPIRSLIYPPMALALLKGIVENKGFNCKTVDLNQMYFTQCESEDQFETDTKMFDNKVPVDFETLYISACGKWITNKVVDLVETHRPKSIGVSCFSHYNITAALLILKVLKEHYADIPVMIGGYGINSPLSFCEEFGLGLTRKESFAETMKSNGLVDTYVVGDAERVMVNWIKNKTDISDKQHKLEKLEGLPYADYTDLDYKNYEYTNGITLPVTGSKGCVRKCSFCDIPGKFGKFVQRDGKEIADEVIYLYETYGAKTIFLTDSLTNGSMKAFLVYIETLSNLKHKRGYKDLQWTGQYIMRPKHQIPHAKNYYPMLAESGAVGLSAGVESGSDRVLEHMNKKCTIDDVYTELEYFNQHKISSLLLLMCGYPTETRSDFEKTLNFLRDIQPYFSNGTVIKAEVSALWFARDPQSQWGRMGPEQGMHFDPNDPKLWFYEPNPELDIKELVFRRLTLHKTINELHIPNGIEKPEMQRLFDYLKHNKENIKKFYHNIKRPQHEQQ